MNIPFFSFDIVHAEVRDQLRNAFDRIIQKGVFILGDELIQFEKSFSIYNKVKYSIGVGSGYDAIYLSLKALGLKAGDEVLVPAHTFVATWHAVKASGLKIVPVDVNPVTCNINTNLLGNFITSKTRAIIPVHMYGQTCDMDEVLDFCRSQQLYCIEDFAQAHGAKYKDRLAGSMGDINATSFYPVKNLGALGDGGMITTNSEALYRSVASKRNYGSWEKYSYQEVGINSRLDELQAAFLNVKLEVLESENARRKAIAFNYLEGLKGIGDLILPVENEDCFHVYHLFVIRTAKRNQLKNYLLEKGIESSIHYPILPHLQSAYQSLGFVRGDYPIAESIAETCLSLPCYPGLSLANQDRIIEAIQDFYQKGI